MVLETGEPKIKAPANPVPREGSLPQQTAAFQLWSHLMDREQALTGISYQAINPIRARCSPKDPI